MMIGISFYLFFFFYLLLVHVLRMEFNLDIFHFDVLDFAHKLLAWCHNSWVSWLMPY